ncbi:hypothetical protein K3169_26875 [Pseudomonas phytophila]|uniref:Uncharacterized protein n=1 Tax=Pseudomonas phytophila TaxID=2867264 RepID=A0ABY6FE18_9PSED|nr:hypothetical protein [Pseudomonas phytophila]UXZ95883.1 hypothetical protein K3169_26875 [Pseudomonas phytophila]
MSHYPRFFAQRGDVHEGIERVLQPVQPDDFACPAMNYVALKALDQCFQRGP